ncbi:DNA polymerase III subunit beta [Shinella sp. JR1-6]|uniref:DNA polymerase III subunit beta n=1 Tax=Shinella sp. JR1-6 TaxID=2527671 RepID=UPI001404CDCD|nr:DNA polymerase III subunit beta [Shinella sp. JR1-6]
MCALALPVPTSASLDYRRFGRAIENVTKVVPRKATIPILGAALITAVKGGVVVTGTDLDVQTSTFVPGRVSPDFKIMVDAHRLQPALAKVPFAQSLDFIRHDDHTVCMFGRTKLQLVPGDDVDQFPVFSRADGLKATNCRFTLDTSELRKALDTVRFAISTDATRYYLNGVFLKYDADQERLMFVTTDGHRLAAYAVDPPAGCEAMHEAGAIIPAATVKEVLRLASRKDAPPVVDIAVSGDAVLFCLGDEQIESKLVDGSFPDYQRVFPANLDRRALFVTAALREAVDRVASVSDIKQAPIAIDIGREVAELTCASEGFGIGSTDLPCLANEPFKVAFSATYLADILERIAGQVSLEINEAANGAGLFLDQKEPNVRFLLMPRRA